ncbi:hypothetical protein ACO0LG_03395 [Undibacterium sp. Ji42W]|uniref:hypothetical protein n=1 Tax=Undibacterium sp. Ji42W TaxID=3413039 RepID=UPI003BF417AF
MTTKHNSYIARETAINTVFSVVLGIAFAFLFFQSDTHIDLGSRKVVLDIMPQSFAVAFMSSLIPSLLTHQRRSNGKLQALESKHSLPRNVFLRSTVTGVIVTTICTAAYAVLGPAQGAIVLILGQFVMLKAVFGGILSLVVTPIALISALRDAL